MWRAYFDQALADPRLSGFQRQVLSDYRVTDAEYAQARALYAQCMADKGWAVSDGSYGGYQIAPAPGWTHPGNNPADDSDACSARATSWVEPIYLGLRDNPDGRTWLQQLRDCYRARGVPDGATMSDDQFQSMVTTPGYHASTPEGKLCYWDPTGALGLTVEEAEAMDRDSDAHTPVEEPPTTP